MQRHEQTCLVRRPGTDARVRLFCFHHAGGGASSFRNWPNRFGSDVDVVAIQLPGRESRFAERPFDCFADAVTTIADEIAPLTDRPFALFGHSMGAMLAYEVARAADRLLQPPALLIVSAADAPSVPRTLTEAETDDDELADLLRINGTTAAVLAKPAVQSFLLRTLRADLRLLDSHRYDAARRLDIPLLAMAGRSDPLVDIARFGAWAELTTAPCEVQLCDGDHFFLRPREVEICALIRARVLARADDHD